MDLKLILKYTGIIMGIIILTLAAQIYLYYQSLTSIMLFAELAGLIITAVAFAKLSGEQIEDRIYYMLTIPLLCSVVIIGIGAFVVRLGRHEAIAASVAFVILPAIIGFSYAAIRRATKTKPKINEPEIAEIEFNKLSAESIKICIKCGKKNRLHDAVLIDLRPVCGVCGGELRSRMIIGTPKPPIVAKPTEPPIQTPELDPVKACQVGVKPETVQELFRLLFDDREKAFRLVLRHKRNHPERSNQWCWDKEIDDLKWNR